MAGCKLDLAGRTVVITGAASGIGRALAVRLSRAGSHLAIVDTDASGLAETRSLLANECLVRDFDVRDQDEMDRFASEVKDWSETSLAPLGMVVNNAGVTASQTFVDGQVGDDAWVQEVNFGGVVNGSRAFLPIMLAQGSGRLVNVSSIFGLLGFPSQSAYCASKHAVRGFSESLRHELRGTGVTVAVVYPGGVKTNIVSNGRFREDDAGNRDHDGAARRFASLAMTTPEQAAATIHKGVLRGRPRIRVGADAVALDLLTRVAPTRYFDVIDVVRRVLDRKDRAVAR